MREAKIIAPLRDNDGLSLAHQIALAQSELVKAFGGCTRSLAVGSWCAPDGTLMTEDVCQLVAACEPGRWADATLGAIAQRFGVAARQLAVYVRYASGDVEIIDTSAAAAQAA